MESGYKSWVRYVVYKYFLLLCGLSFILLTVSFKEQKILHQTKSGLPTVSLVDYTFGVVSKRPRARRWL